MTHLIALLVALLVATVFVYHVRLIKAVWLFTKLCFLTASLWLIFYALPLAIYHVI